MLLIYFNEFEFSEFFICLQFYKAYANDLFKIEICVLTEKGSIVALKLENKLTKGQKLAEIEMPEAVFAVLLFAFGE